MERSKKETATAIENYTAQDDTQISFQVGDLIEVLQRDGDGLWYGRNSRGKMQGYFPSSAVQLSRGRVNSVAATIVNLVPTVENSFAHGPKSPATVSQVNKAKPAILPKPMISPKPKIGNSSPQIAQMTTETDNEAFTESHFDFKAKLVEDVINRRQSALYLKDVNNNNNNNHNDEQQNMLPVSDSIYNVETTKNDSDDDDDWENENDDEMMVVAFAAYEPTGPDQLCLTIGDVIKVSQTTESGWWQGSKINDNQSVTDQLWFPSSYVKPLGKEYQHFEQHKRESKSRNPVNKSNSMRKLLDMPKKILVKAAATAAVMSDVTLWRDSANSAPSPSPKPSSRSLSIFYANDNTKANDLTEDHLFDFDDSDYGTDQTSIASFSQLYSFHIMCENKTVKNQAQQRLDIIFELFTSEKKYIGDLYFILENFRNSLKANGLLTETELELVFVNLDQIYATNYYFYDELKSRIESNQDNIRVCDILLHHLPKMIPIYKTYCAGLSAAVTKVDTKCNDPFFSDFLKQISEHNETFLPLTQYIRKPVQRILKYPFLIEAMLKSTDLADEDHHDCEQALKCAKMFCKEIDNQLIPGSHVWEPFEHLSWLQTHLIIKNATDLIDFNSETQFLGPRVLLHASFLQNMNNKKMIACYLFNDLLILALPQKRLHNVPLVSNFFQCQEALQCKYTLYRKPFLLDDLIVTVRSEYDCCFELYINSIAFSIKLQATTFDQYKQWLDQIDLAKQNYGKIQKRNSEHMHHLVTFPTPLTTPIAILLLASIKAIQLYTRSYTLNAYCKVAMGDTEWSKAHSVLVTKPIHVDLHVPKSNASPSNNSQFYLSGATKELVNNSITWETNYLINIHSTDDRLMIRCYDENQYAPHQFLGEAVLPMADLIKQAKHLKGFIKGVQLSLPNEQLAKKLLANYQIKPCLEIKFDIL